MTNKFIEEVKKLFTTKNIVQLIFLGLIFFIIQIIYSFYSEAIHRNFSTLDIGYFAVAILIGTISAFIIWATISAKIIGKKNTWTGIAIAAIIGAILGGFIIIDYYYGAEPLLLHLRNSNNVVIDNLTCTSTDKIAFYEDTQLLSGEKIQCTSKSLNLTYPIKLTFILENNSKIEVNSLYFEAPSNLKRIEFIGTCIENNNNTLCSTGHNYRFLNIIENENRKNNFLNALILLFTTSIFTIPSAVLNMRQLWRDKND